MHINQSWAVDNAAVVLRPKPSEFPFHYICAVSTTITFLSVISRLTAVLRDRHDVDGGMHMVASTDVLKTVSRPNYNMSGLK